MDIDFVEEIVPVHPDDETLNYNRTDVLCPNVKTEYFNTVDINDVMSSDSCLAHSIESSYFTHNGIRKNDLNTMTKAVMESVPYADGLQYLAAISSFSDNFKVYSRVIVE